MPRLHLHEEKFTLQSAVKTAFPSKRLAMLTLTISHQRRGLNGTGFQTQFLQLVEEQGLDEALEVVSSLVYLKWFVTTYL
ncbi:hypothetical protein [Brevibacillus formosus]|uniref:hypothetical protein n=2 Tax=Brevibacillus formosus TaxID=54913 RepID=UPI0018CD62D1|nr:hypothetical protein [Brevibacillus formosus]